MSELQLVPIRRLIDDVVQYGRRHWRQILPSIALAQFSIGLLALLLQGPQMELANSPDPSLDDSMALLALLFPLLFVMMGVVMVAFSAVMVAALDAVHGRPVDMRRAWIFSLRPKVFFTHAAVFFVTMLSAMCCFFPVLYVGPILTFVTAVMVQHEVFGSEAIRRSIALAQYNPTGRWQDSSMLHILGVLVAGTVVNYALTFVVQLPLLIVQVVMTMREAADGQLNGTALPPMWLQLPTQALVAVATAASWLYWCFAIAGLYREIIRRRDGADLQQAIDGLTGDSRPI